MQKSLFALCMLAVTVSAAPKVDKTNNGKAGKEQGTVGPVEFTLNAEPSAMAKNAKFARYAAKQGKNYQSKAEYQERKANFEATDKEIDRLNKKAGKQTFGHNKFSDFTDAEKKALLPALPESDLKGSTFAEYLEQAKGRHLQSVQDVDWRTPVRDQGYCGSCVAFAVSTVLESARVAQGVTDVNGTAATLGEISQQHLVSCGFANGYPNVFGCDGAWGYGYMQMLSQEGWMAYADFPAYTSGDVGDTKPELCSANYDATKAVKSVQSYNNDVSDAGYTLDMTKTNDIIARLQTSPLYIAVDAMEPAFMNYNSSDIVTSDTCSGQQLNHMVSLVGFTKGTTVEGPQTTTEVTTTVPAESVNPDYIDWTNYWIYCPSTHSDYITYDYVWWYGYYNFKCWRAEYTETKTVTTGGTVVTPDYFTIQNSWGSGWGDNGFIKIAAEPGLGPCLMNYVTGWMDLVAQETNAA